jgi:predicted DCC family thiol-disulfide oxidoreductase YuxK
VHTEQTDIQGRRGWIFYNAECPICRRSRKVWGGIFARRGFEWLPLQTPGVANRLGLSETAVLEEMKLQLPSGRVLGGIDSWVVLFRSVWWLWPLGAMLSLPGFHGLGQACYRRIARNRYCLGGRCGFQGKPRRKIQFLDLP